MFSNKCNKKNIYFCEKNFKSIFVNTIKEQKIQKKQEPTLVKTQLSSILKKTIELTIYLTHHDIITAISIILQLQNFFLNFAV